MTSFPTGSVTKYTSIKKTCQHFRTGKRSRKSI